LFSDYAEKQRFIKLPAGKQLTKVDSGLPTFPNGSKLVKTFYYWNDKSDPSKGKKIIETRLLVFEDDEWMVGVYKWNDVQTEAFLLSSGYDEAVNWINEKGENKQNTYHIPSTKECITCHQVNDVFKPIGPKLFNLNTTVKREGNTVNQLAFLQDKGLVDPFDISSIDSLPNYKDLDVSLELRARAYMEVNCSHCHNTNGGFAPKWLTFDFHNYTPLDETGIVDNKDQIIEMVDTETMPFIGTSIKDEAGVELIIEYLNTL
jgi:mono/diheme cytochrome c family protein